MSASALTMVAQATCSDVCFHCGEPLPAECVRVEIAGRRERVCCAGCAAAAVWIRDAGLDDYYRLRNADGNRVEPGSADFSIWDRADVQSGHAINHGSDREITLVVEGIRCAACAWLIDRALRRETGVSDVGVNAVTGRLRLRWRPAQTALSRVLQRLAALGYRPHLAGGLALEQARQRERNALLLRLGVAALAATQAMMFSEALYLDSAQQMPTATRDLFRWLTFLVCTPVVFYSGAPFFSGLRREWRERRFGMDTLAASGIAFAYLGSLIETLRGGAHVWFDAAAMFVLFLLFARVIESFARQRACARVDALARAQPALAWRLRDGGVEHVPIAALAPGDRVRVPADSSVPADGVLEGDAAAFDEALLSGEARPQAKRAGDMVFAGSIACSAVAVLRIVATGSATRLSQIQRLVQEAQAQRPTLARLADRVAAYFVAVSLLLTLAVFAIWWQLEPARAFPVALAVLVAACPCALSLAVPAALSAANDALSRQGVLIVGEDALERLARVDTVLFDKTGTLTRGRPRLRNVQVFAPDLDAERALQLAAALEQDSRHPLAAAFRSERPLLVQGLQPHPGLGLEGQVQGQCLRLGRADFAAAVRDDGDLWLGDGERALARFELRDELREDAHEAMARLRALALELRIASGDGADAVGETATALRIEHTDARLSPAGKLARIRELQSQGHRVLMLGDGINDAPVLAGADVSMAMGDGSALAQRAADILLLDGALTRLPQAIALARRTQRVLRQNLCWALLYNAASLALAASGQLHPGVAALGMAASSLWVTFNALRLARPRMPRP